MKQQFTFSERKEILDRVFKIFIEYDAAAAEYEKNKTSDELKEKLKKEMEMQSKELYGLVQRYTDGTPVPAISRCPFTGERLSHSIDTFGLDGLWWNSDSPIRPVEDLPKTYYSMSGALKLSGDIEKAPFICEPGPDVPFVVPRLLEYNQIKAVVSCIKVGAHTAYIVFYYADPMLYAEERLNEWGSEHYQYFDENGTFRFIRAEQYGDEYDFELEDWIRRGKLLWILPGDEKMMLRSDVETCPYLNLEGDRREKFIQNGEMWRKKGPEEYKASEEYGLTEEEVNSIIESLKKGER